jgi:hypothetical protein
LDLKRFDSDLKRISQKVLTNEEPEIKQKLDTIRLHLVDLYKANLVKINHSVMELVCAKQLMLESYDVTVEHKLGNNLVCDVHGEKGEGKMIVEIETGFVPPGHALDPFSYTYARIISKIARYSAFANRFVLATTISNILPIPKLFKLPPRMRDRKDLEKAKTFCDAYYANPPISLEEITYGELHSIFILNVDRGSVKEQDVEKYLSETKEIQRMVD